VDITITFDTGDASFGRRSTATAADTSGKAPPLLAVEIRTDDSYSSDDSPKDTLLLALVAALFACAS
jgi:hypothetical protein